MFASWVAWCSPNSGLGRPKKCLGTAVLWRNLRQWYVFMFSCEQMTCQTISHQFVKFFSSNVESEWREQRWRTTGNWGERTGLMCNYHLCFCFPSRSGAAVIGRPSILSSTPGLMSHVASRLSAKWEKSLRCLNFTCWGSRFRYDALLMKHNADFTLQREALFYKK